MESHRVRYGGASACALSYGVAGHTVGAAPMAGARGGGGKRRRRWTW